MDVAVEAVRFTRGSRTVLDVPELGFLSGTTTAVFGPNGSGKTTLLRLVGGLEQPTAGRVRVGPTPVGWRAPTAPDFAFGFQAPVFLGGTVRRNLDLALRLRGHEAPTRALRIAEAAEACGIAPLLDRKARQLSAGESQRASLARTLALRAPVTLLDEPLAGVDRATRLQLLDELPDLLATFATTTILVTHDREEAMRLADHLVVLVDGRVRAAGPKQVVWAHPRDRATAELLGYTVVWVDGGEIAIPPGALTMGTGEPRVCMVVERTVEMGSHRHALGRVGADRVDIRVPRGQPVPGSGQRVPLVAEVYVTLRE